MSKGNAAAATTTKAAGQSGGNEKPLGRTALTQPPTCGLQRGYFVCNERRGHKGGHKVWENGRIVFAWPR